MLTRSGTERSGTFRTAADVIAAMRPDEPVYLYHPRRHAEAACAFIAGMGGAGGDTFYAVKCNDHPAILRALVDAGVHGFDAASLVEIEQVRAQFPTHEIFLTHPIKSRTAIGSAHYDHAVSTFVVDHIDEYRKIREEIPAPVPLTILVRIQAEWDCLYRFSHKFGAAPADAIEIMRAVAAGGDRVGITFHSGSQANRPGGFRAAVADADSITAEAQVDVVVLDVGGGFPTENISGADANAANDQLHQPMFAEIRRAVEASGRLRQARLIAEPGRALASSALSILIRVLHRRGDSIYINDSVWGNLLDSWVGKFPLYAEQVGEAAGAESGGTVFTVFGMTCGTSDVLKCPMVLPSTLREGDWIELHSMGAYTLVCKTPFNGFRCEEFITVAG
jgi:ornithine decarboxylase